MRLHEIINEKEQLDEVLPHVPLAIAGGKAIAGAMGLGKAGVAAHAAKIAAKKFGAPALNKTRQWLSKAPPDSSVPDALQKDKVGYGPDQVDPPLAQAARQKLAVAGAGVVPKNKFSKAIGPMSNLERKRLK